ncbi:unnamed protein product [Rotaria magnacalcarata]
MTDTEIEHIGHPILPPGSCFLRKFSSTITTDKIRKVTESQNNQLVLFDYLLEIYNPQYDKYYLLDDSYLLDYNPFGLTNNVAIKLKVTWIKKNENDQNQTEQQGNLITPEEHSSELSNLIFSNVHSRHFFLFSDHSPLRHKGLVVHQNMTQTPSSSQFTTIAQSFERDYFGKNSQHKFDTNGDITDVVPSTQFSCIILQGEKSSSQISDTELLNDLEDCDFESMINDPEYCEFKSMINDPSLNLDNFNAEETLEELSSTNTALRDSVTNKMDVLYSITVRKDQLQPVYSTIPEFSLNSQVHKSGQLLTQILIPDHRRLGINASDDSTSINDLPSSRESTSVPIQCGLKNMGNTCYMNVTLQILARLTPLIDWNFNTSHLKKCERRSTCSICLIEETLKGMSKESINSDNPIFIPTLFYNQLTSLSPTFTKNTQQDCIEFFFSLFMNAEESSILSKTFEIDIDRATRCSTCSSIRYRSERQKIIDCPVPKNSGKLVDCLNNYFEEENLTGDNAYDCDTCQVKQNGYTKMEIGSTPPVLLISLKRFKSNGDGKLHSEIEYEELLHLDEWLSKNCLNNISDKQKIYQLFAVVIHTGNNMSNGHYMCYVKNQCTDDWKLYAGYEKYAIFYKHLIAILFHLPAKPIVNRHIAIPDQTSLNDMKNQVQFCFLENVISQQRRYAKCDVFGNSDLDNPKCSRCLWIQGEHSTTEKVSYPKLKLDIPPEYHNYSWSLEVYTVTESYQNSTIHYKQLVKKFLQDRKHPNVPSINPIEIKIKQEDLANGFIIFQVCVVNEPILARAKHMPLVLFYDSEADQFIVSSNTKSANELKINLKNFHLVCQLKVNKTPLKSCISSHMTQLDDGDKEKHKRKNEGSSRQSAKKLRTGDKSTRNNT